MLGYPLSSTSRKQLTKGYDTKIQKTMKTRESPEKLLQASCPYLPPDRPERRLNYHEANLSETPASPLDPLDPPTDSDYGRILGTIENCAFSETAILTPAYSREIDNILGDMSATVAASTSLAVHIIKTYEDARRRLHFVQI
ncbi:uncharacterized protein F5147DRAFT_777728 [Suillus discolor]|uniref:Uncharacterized protein n=1 Tax=Suillus discolor TaxID=1912936 RepID=A0A9P7EYH3_9AGAM|nr:uncharacterized protein F5147DRAFT_777728 [Suillus discolor]KAG2098232.1 hypothetical protein F5147DRAFT_777728 [Suillus discolor]